MIPYYHLETIPLGHFRMSVFGILLMTAILVGRWRILHLERSEGRSDERNIALLCLVMLVFGLICAHVAKIVLADIPAFLVHPAIVLQKRHGIMSVGGFYGGLMAGLIWCKLRRVSGFETIRMLDRIAFVLPLSWMIGRLGCALIHDHVGQASTGWFAVRFPSGSAYDLGVLEFLFLIPLSILFEALGRRPMPPGFFFGLFGVLYGALRAWLETLQPHPPTFTWGPKAGLVGMATGFAGWIAMLYYKRQASKYPVATSAMAARRYQL
jgi:phosphatidylglycerol:prolipoprotein diacylglycerol transferase